MMRRHIIQSRAGFIAAAALMISVMGSSNAVAAPEARFFPAGESADAPEGFLAMCRRDRVLCSAGHPARQIAMPREIFSGANANVDARGRASPGLWHQASLVTAAPASSPPAAALTWQAAGSAGYSDPIAEKRLIRRINSHVNSTVRQLSDDVTAGTGEYWQRPAPEAVLRGDCEDIAIEKRAQLLEIGFPADRLFFAVAYRRGFGLHAVLIARLADGDYVLDSLFPAVRLWASTGYSWLRQQSPTDPMRWSRIGGRLPQTQMAAAADAVTAF